MNLNLYFLLSPGESSSSSSTPTSVSALFHRAATVGSSAAGNLTDLSSSSPWADVVTAAAAAAAVEPADGRSTTKTSKANSNWQVFLLFVLVVAGVTGNVLVCIAVAVERKLQNVTNYFLVSLAMADLFVSVIVMPICIVQEFLGHWPFGLFFCGLWQVSDVTMCTSSIMHMCTISMDRYMGIKDPLKTRNRSHLAVCFKIITVWALSLAIASPLIFLVLYRPNEILGPLGQCAIFNSHFLVYGSLAAFFLPLLVMLVTYSLTIRMLSVRARQLERRAREGMRRSLSRRKDRRYHQSFDHSEGSTTKSGTSSGMTTIGDSGSAEETDRRQSGTGNTSEAALTSQQLHRKLYLSVEDAIGDDAMSLKLPPFLRSSRKSVLARPIGQERKSSAPLESEERLKDSNEAGNSSNGTELEPLKNTDRSRLNTSQNDSGFSQRKHSAEDRLLRERDASHHQAAVQTWIMNSDENRPYVVVSSPECHHDEQLFPGHQVTLDDRRSSSDALEEETTDRPGSHPPPTNSRLQVLIQKHSSAIRIAGMFLNKPRESRGSKTSLSSVKTEQKAVKVLGTMFFLFVACWTSFFSVNLATGLCSSCNFDETMFKCFLWLGYSSSMLNPIIYTVFNKAFKGTFVRLLTCAVCREWSASGTYCVPITRCDLCDGKTRAKDNEWTRSTSIRMLETKL